MMDTAAAVPLVQPQRHPPGSYRKLANTPLAIASTKICGCNPRIFVCIVALISLAANGGTYCFMGYYAFHCEPYKEVLSRWDGYGARPELPKKTYSDKLPSALGFMCYILGALLAMSIIMGIWAGWDEPCFAGCWYIFLILNGAIRVMCLLMFFAIECKLFWLNGVFIIGDVIMLVFMKMSWGLMHNVARQKKYSKSEG